MTNEINIRSGSLADLNSIFNIEKKAFLTDPWSIKMIKLKNILEASNIWKIFDMKQRLYDDAMDIEMDMKSITNDLGQLHKDMEQEAEPSGGKVADKYGKQMNNLEKQYKKKKLELKKVFSKIDKLERY